MGKNNYRSSIRRSRVLAITIAMTVAACTSSTSSGTSETSASADQATTTANADTGDTTTTASASSDSSTTTAAGTGDTTTTAAASTTATTTKVQSSDCADLVPNAQLVVYPLSDYCEFTDPANTSGGADGATATALTNAQVTVDQCDSPDSFRAYLKNKILVSPGTGDNQRTIRTALQSLLGASANVTYLDVGSSGVALGTVTGGRDLQPVDMLALQRPGIAVDLDWIGSAAPNWTFRPVDEPEEASTPTTSTAPASSAQSVAVFDTPDATTGQSDVESNGKRDEMYGHSEFVSDLITQYSGAATTLFPVDNAQAKQAGMIFAGNRWSPMAFSEGDLVAAIAAASNDATTYDAWNMSLGAFACPGDAAFFVVLQQFAAAATAGKARMIFAAAGNSGVTQPHYPAALREEKVVSGWAVTDPQAKKEVEDAARTVAPRIHAVGSVDVDENGSVTGRSDFSACGTWIDAQESGRGQVAKYPAVGGSRAVTWSGTSFATARATARYLRWLPAKQGDEVAQADTWFQSC